MYVSGDLEVQYMKRLPTTFLKAFVREMTGGENVKC